MSRIPARDRLIKCRVNMLLKFPFWGPLVTRLKLVEADEWCQTLATDGRSYFYNTKFIEKLDDEEMIFGFCHEIGHIMWDHIGRLNGRIPQVYNMAGDYVINNMLVRERLGRAPSSKINMLIDAKFNNMNSDEVYDYLMKHKVTIVPTFDMHLDMDGDDSKDSDGEGRDKPNFKKLSEEERKALRDEWKEAVIQAAQEAGAGNVPGEVARLVKDITEPVMDLKDLLRIQFCGSLKSDYTWMRPNRKGWHTGAILPGQLPGEELDIVVAIDASGSIDNKMLVDFLGIVQGSLDQFQSYKVRVISFDTKAYNEDVFTSDDGRNMSEYGVKGGGGTDFECVWDWMKYNDINPHQLVMFTDGYPGGTWGDENYCDTLFVVYGSRASIEAPFGITAHYQ